MAGWKSGPVTKGAPDVNTKGRLLAVPNRPAMGVVFAVQFQSEAQPVVTSLYNTKGLPASGRTWILGLAEIGVAVNTLILERNFERE